MKKRFFSVCVFFSLLVAAVLVSCADVGAPTFNAPVREFFKKNTDMAMVAGYRFGEALPKDNGGSWCTPSGENCVIYLELHNPQNYDLSLDVVCKNGVVTTDCAVTLSGTSAKIVIPHNEFKEFEDLSPTIKLTDRATGRAFPEYTIPLKVNTPPPEVENATVMVDGSGNYFLCFNFPSANDLKDIHKDLDKQKLTINNKSYNISVSNGVVSISGDEILKNVTGLSAPDGGTTFVPGGQSFYAKVLLSATTTIYKITLVDDAGLSTTATMTSTISNVKVGTVEQYKNAVKTINNGATDLNVTLTADIDLSSATESTVIRPKNGGADIPYTGTFNGQGHTVTISLNSSNDQETDCSYVGIVRQLGSGGVVENVCISANETLTAITNGHFSGIAIRNDGTIRNCVNNVSFELTTFRDMGGICIDNYGTIENCLNTGDFTSNFSKDRWARRYGVLGGITASNYDSGIVRNCVNTGTMKAMYDYETRGDINGCPGAIAGYQNGSITNCYWVQNCVLKRKGNSGALKPYSYVTWQGTYNANENKEGVTGCGIFGSVNATSTTLTAGTVDNCGQAQSLATYATDLVSALNAWVNAQSTPSIYKTWSISGSEIELH